MSDTLENDALNAGAHVLTLLPHHRQTNMRCSGLSWFSAHAPIVTGHPTSIVLYSHDAAATEDSTQSSCSAASHLKKQGSTRAMTLSRVHEQSLVLSGDFCQGVANRGISSMSRPR